MNLCLDESIHTDYGFMLLGYVFCEKDPKDEVSAILEKYGLSEFHASEKMKNNAAMQSLRCELASFVNSFTICASHMCIGIQLADLVAALNGVRLREEISNKPKMLIYGEDYGYNPPIEAELGFELWAKLRYSMLRQSIPRGDDMPEMAMFPTRGYGLFISPNCSTELAEKADKVFGIVYLGCIH